MAKATATKNVNETSTSTSTSTDALATRLEQAKRRRDRQTDRKTMLDAAKALASVAKAGVKQVKAHDKDGRAAVRMEYSTAGIASTGHIVADAIMGIAEKVRRICRDADAMHGDTMTGADGHPMRFKDIFGAVLLGLTDTAKEVAEHGYGAIASESAALDALIRSLEAELADAKG